ncbi:MAG: hypothetical protein AB7F89_26255 [Pirellulaceae bacterium]
MTQKSEPFNPFDPAGVFKEMRDTSMDAWAKSMLQLVHTDAYAEATGAMLDAWLSGSAPFRKALDASIQQTLSSVNVPSREDVTRLAERLTNIEMRLDDLDAKFDELLRRLPAG